jgi:hypothetical protein
MEDGEAGRVMAAKTQNFAQAPDFAGLNPFDGSMHRGLTLAAQHRMALAGALGTTALLAIVVVSYKPELALVPIGVLGGVSLWRALRYTVAHPMWLSGVLVLIELITATWLLSDAPRAVFHYGLIAAFCLPMLPGAWRNRSFTREGFRLYLCYFLWAAVTILYSLAPAFSIGRLLASLTAFGAVSFAVSQIEEPQDVPRLLTPLLLACGVVVVVVVFSAFALPRSLTWIVPTENDIDSAGDVVRFCSIFDGPNDVGQLMMVTVGCAAVLWPHTRGRRRLLLGVLIVMAVGAAALADSRTPFVALTAGAACFAVWKYRGRAVAVVLLLMLCVAASHLGLDREGYLARGNVTTLTGRTDVWEFALSQIKQRPLLGYGYGAAGAILQNRYFPVWWGPWDLGAHSSLHDGYIDRAASVGIPALLLWLFIVLRPWYGVLRLRDDPWGLKPVAFWMVIPMLIHNLTEASISDCTGLVGIAFFLTWAIAEKVRILRREQEVTERRRQRADLSPVAAALSAAALLVFVFLAFVQTARAQSNYHFPALPPHAALPSGAQCAVAASNGSSWEPRPENSAANHSVPTFVELVSFHLAPIKGSFAPISDFLRVDGKFTGTTDQILRWGACKWGIDEDVVRAQAVVESDWHQSRASDASHDPTQCPPGTGFPGAWDGTTCQQSYGIMQMKFVDFGGWPMPKDDTAFNVDFRLAYQRACMNGDIAYLAQQNPMGGYPRYPNGTTDQMLWGCMGDWYSGAWLDEGALGYIASVKAALANRTWMRPGF